MGRPATAENPVSFRLPSSAREILREVSEHLGMSQNNALATILLEISSLHRSSRFPRDSMLFTPALQGSRRPVKAAL